jgi:hypothetical protein
MLALGAGVEGVFMERDPTAVRTAVPSNDSSESLADDLLRGAEAIAAFVGLDIRQAFYGLQRGYIPAVKDGHIWVTTKSRLRRHYDEGCYQPRSRDTAAEPAAAASPCRKPPAIRFSRSAFASLHRSRSSAEAVLTNAASRIGNASRPVRLIVHTYHSLTARF